MPSTGKIKAMENAAEAIIGDIQVVCFELGGQKFGLEVSCVEEIIRPREISGVADSTTCMLGQITWNEQEIPLLDMRMRLAPEAGGNEAEVRIIIINFDGRLIAAQVDSIAEVLRIPGTEIIGSHSSHLNSKARAVVKGVYQGGDDPVYILDCDQIFRS